MNPIKDEYNKGCQKVEKTVRQLHEEYIKQEKCRRMEQQKRIDEIQKRNREKREEIKSEIQKRQDEYSVTNGITLSDNPYRAKLQKIAALLIWVCRISKFILLITGCYQIICICFDAAGITPKAMMQIENYNVFIRGMRDFKNIPGVVSLKDMHQQMISHFIMLLLTLGLLWIVRQLYGLLLNVATDGNPFTKDAIRSLHKICIPMLLMMFWNIPMSICLILFVLFVSFIFEYGIYLQEKADETLHVQEDVILSFAEITEAKSGQTGQHIKRVSEYTRLLAEEMGMGAQKSDELRIASMMHDVGKLLIPSEILDKPGKLTDDEFAVIKKHTDYGEQLLANAHGEIMDTSRLVAKEHHEKWDGNGYAHVKGEDISIEGRIVAVADVYDALTSRRSYKDAWSDKEAYDEIIRCSGTHFDPDVVEAFKACYPKIQQIRAAYADNN